MPDNLVVVPKRLSDVSVTDMWDFIQLIKLEVEQAGLSAEEREKLLHRTQAFGIIFQKEAYFRQAYCQPMARAVQAIFQRFQRPKVVDVGCGTGAQAILFAALGGSVLGLDRDVLQLQTARKRIGFYEQRLGRKLDIDLREADLLKHDFAAEAGAQVLYSHGCIGRIFSAEDIFRIASEVLAPGGLVILKVGNPSCLWSKLARAANDLSSAADYERAGRARGFRPLRIAGTTAIPRPLWFFGEATHLLDAPLRQVQSLCVHLELIFERTGG